MLTEDSVPWGRGRKYSQVQVYKSFTLLNVMFCEAVWKRHCLEGDEVQWEKIHFLYISELNLNNNYFKGLKLSDV